jgi:hypothetical protein
MTELKRKAECLIDRSIADSTRRNYVNGLRNYILFCEQFDLVPFPLHQNNVILFATDLSTSISVSSINVQLSAIKFMDQKYGYNSKFSEFKRLYLLMRGIKRSQGLRFHKKKRLPITPVMLMEMKSRLFNSSRRFGDKKMVWAAMMCAFFGFLRISEYTSGRAKTYDQCTTLCVADITFNKDRDSCNMQLKASKTDPFREGVQIRLEENKSQLCPIQALQHFLSTHPTHTGPLFTFENGSYLTRQSFSKVLKSLLPEVVVSTHSFRIGAATTAAAAGFPRWLIKSLGRWSSDCFREYIRIPNSMIKQVSTSLIREPGNSVVFDPDLV